MALTNHILPDSPTNNFATWNPLDAVNSAGSLLGEFSEGNLKCYVSASVGNAPRMLSFATIYPPNSGKWYLEFSGIDNRTAGLVYESVNKTGLPATNYILVGNNEVSYNDGTLTSGGQAAVASTDILGLLYDVDTATISFYKNGTQLVVFGSVTTNIKYAFASCHNSSAANGSIIANFGQDPTFGGAKSPTTTYTDANGIGAFYYQPPTGALALCTANLPDFTPDVDDDVPQDYFKAAKYTGQTTADAGTWDSGTTTSTIAVGFQPDLVWLKPRSLAFQHQWYDSVRGALKRIGSSQTNAENTETQTLKSFTSSGFTLGNDNGVNTLSSTNIAWCWKAGGAPTADNSNTSGAMTANSVSLNGTLQSNYTPAGSPTIYPKRMSINTDAGFSIVKYTGSGISGSTFPHGLSSPPEFVIFKALDDINNWTVITPLAGSLSSGTYLFLNSPQEAKTSTDFNAMALNVSTITLDTSTALNSTFSYIAYCWHSVEGYSKFGSYTGNGSADGPFVYCGFRPAWVMVKRTVTDGYGWHIWDTAREPHNYMYNFLAANASTNEANNTYYKIDFLSNGFKLRNDDGIMNASTNYIFMAFAEQPFKYSNAR